MTALTLKAAQTILATALDHCRAGNFKPMAIVVLDERGALRAAASEDGTSLKRTEVAHGKAYGALSLGMGSRSLFKRAKEQAFFISAVSHVVGGALVPVPGGVLIRDADGAVAGVVGISGDTSENDEAAASAGIKAAGFTPDPGSD
ncbi:MAG TPA: heme-binding protein [Xanthobacteraceae bacterium]|nr:heme-binding protein [Xanthobacteraceae bacterium]